MKTNLIIASLILMSSCSSMHLKMKSDYTSSTGPGTATYEKSYKLGSFPWICGVSAIFFGGGCWAYLMMPTVPQEQKFLEDAKKALGKETSSTGVEFVEPEVTRESWSDQEAKLVFEPGASSRN